MLRISLVASGTLRLSLLVAYSELGMVMMNYLPHRFSRYYLYLALVLLGRIDESKRPWNSIKAMCNDHRKEIAIGKEFPKDIRTLQTHAHLAAGVSLLKVAME
jgi:hypothetical protein